MHFLHKYGPCCLTLGMLGQALPLQRHALRCYRGAVLFMPLTAKGALNMARDHVEVHVGQIELEYQELTTFRKTFGRSLKPKRLTFRFTYHDTKDMRLLVDAVKRGQIVVKKVKRRI